MQCCYVCLGCRLLLKILVSTRQAVAGATRSALQSGSPFTCVASLWTLLPRQTNESAVLCKS